MHPQARALVGELRRARVNGYAPRLAALPAHVARGRSVKWQRTVLAQHRSTAKSSPLSS